MTRKILAVVLAVTVLLCAGCGSTGTVDDYVTNDGYIESATEQGEKDAADITETAAGTPVIKKEDIKIGVLYIGSASETSGYTYTHELGVEGMAENLGISDEQIVRKENVADSDVTAINQALQECVDEGCNIIFTTSWGYMEPTAAFAEKYPDIYFAHGTGYMSNGKNFTNYFGRIYQARYLSGIVAGTETTTNKIGYVAAMGTENSEVTGGVDAFALGVESVNPDAQIFVKVTNSWYDPEGEKAAAEALLDAGCDVLSQHCDTTAPQEAAQARGVYGIGYNSDMSKETPDATLTSVIWTWSAYYTSFVQSVMDGSYDGSNYYEGMTMGLVGLSDYADFVDESVTEKVNTAKQSILDGSYGVFDGELETNDGRTVGNEGSTLEDTVITGGIDWYYHNVVVME